MWHAECLESFYNAVDRTFCDAIKLETIIKESQADEVGDTIRQAANTEKIGDGKTFILPIRKQ